MSGPPEFSASPHLDQFPADRRIRWRWAIAAAIAGAAAYFAANLVPAVPGRTSLLAAFGDEVSRRISLATGVFPIATGELLAGVYIVWIFAVLTLAVRSVLARRRRWRNAVAGGVRRALRDGGIAVLIFYALWGRNYASAGIETRLDWPEWTDVSAAELTRLADDAVRSVNEAYIELHGTTDAGRPTRLADAGTDLDTAIDAGWARAAESLGLPESVGARYGPVKKPLFSHVLIRFGIIGVYFPFTGEANVFRALPAVQLAHTMAHEKAHQRGIAGEAEASFLGFVAAGSAPSPLARYGAAMFAHMQIMSALGRAAPDQRRRIAAERLPGVRRDLADLSEFYARYRGPRVVRRVGSAVNDHYLRANRVAGGVQNYQYSARLLVTYARENGGHVMPPVPANGYAGEDGASGVGKSE